jgi:glyoxylase-like metal-dependent hydrolase (beta-lactamase superfamily II)
MEIVEEGNLRLVKEGPLGSFANNAYLLQDKASGDTLVIDAPQDGTRVLDALDGGRVSAIVVTHRHADHWASIDAVKDATHARVLCHDADREPYAAKVDGTIADGEELSLGALRVRVIHTPGHTPGSICLLVGSQLITGDALFPGGPGRTATPADLRQAIHSITSRLFELPDDTRVHPGHGDGTTLGASKREYAVFASREHPADLCGDVTWEAG